MNIPTDTRITKQKWVSNRVWNKNEDILKKNLNTELMYQILYKEGLLTHEHAQEYRDMPTGVAMSKHVVKSIPECGRDDYLATFLGCLKNSFMLAGQAHEQLVETLENAYEEAMNDPSLETEYDEAMRETSTIGKK